VDRQLERGYTLTLGHDGRIVRSVTGLATGAMLVTRFADGTAVSDVRQVHTVPRETDDSGPRPAGGRSIDDDT
jgi:exonuclease VII large subunit